jgi:AcrR family transcriptional regulator
MASNRQDGMRADRRADVLRVAHEIFATCGYARARIHDIATGARVSEAFVYRMFGSKSGLFDAATRQPLERAAAQIVEVAERLRASSRLGRYEQSYIGHEDLFEAMRGLAPMLAAGLGRDGESSPSLINDSLGPVIEQLRGSIGDARVGVRGWRS